MLPKDIFNILLRIPIESQGPSLYRPVNFIYREVVSPNTLSLVNDRAIM